MGLTRVAVGRPLFITMVFLAVVVFGFVAYGRLGVELLPSINFPAVTVVTPYPGAGPESVESLVTAPIEDALSGLSDLDYIQSTSVEGISTIVVVFTERASVDAAAFDVERKVNAIRGSLPADVRPPTIVKADINALPILNLALSGPLAPGELTALAEDLIVPRLTSVGGVAAVTLVGQQKREIQVRVDVDRLRAYGLSLQQIGTALAQENVSVPGGQISESGREYNVRLGALAAAPQQLGNLVVASSAGGEVHLRDVAEVRDATVKRTQINRSSGKDSVGLLISKQATANTVSVAEAVKKELGELRAAVPSGVQVDVVTDASVFTRRSLDGVQRELIEAILLVGFVLLLFLHAWRSTFIVLLAIPTSLIATLVVMYALGFTLNLMSLLGLTLTIGILVDDSIVVLENIFRHLEMGEAPFSAAINGRSEIGLAAIAITLVDVVVYMPVALLSGITGQFFREFGLVVVAAALFSLFVSFTLTPMLASRWLKASGPGGRSPLAAFGRVWDAGYARVAGGYRSLLVWSLRHRWPVVGVGLASFAVGIGMVALNVVGTEFVPDADQSEFTLVAEMPPGTALEVTDQAMAYVEGQLNSWPEVQRTFTSVGVGAENRPAQSRFGRIVVKLVPLEERQRTAREVAFAATRLAEGVPNVKLRASLPSLAGGGGQPLQIEIKGDDAIQLRSLARQVQSIVESVPGTRDVQNTGAEGQPEVVVTLDVERAADLGIGASQAAGALRTAISGTIATQFRPEVGKAVDVRLLAEEEALASVEQIRQLPVASSRGTLVSMGQISKLEERAGSPQIDRRDRKRVITVSANLEGRPLGDVVRDVEEELEEVNIPSGYSVTFGGVTQEQRESFALMFQALALSVLLTYMVTVALYESLLTPFVVMLSLPLALVGAIGALALAGSTLNLLSLIGLIMLVGLVGKNAILLLDYANHLRRSGLNRDEALLEAGPTRLRPILMTALSLIVALMPVAAGLGEGSELRRPIAIPVVGGVATSTLLTLVFIPAVYTLFDDLIAFVRRRMGRSGPDSGVGSDGHRLQPAGEHTTEVVVGRASGTF